MTKANTSNFWQSRWGYLAEAVALLLVIYLIASWAIDNGSLWLYIIDFVLFGFTINRIVRAVRHK